MRRNALAGKTTEELLALSEQIESDPANKGSGIWRFNEKARKKLDAIREQITHNLMEKKKAAGTYVDYGGYSGRKSKKRH